MITKDKIYVIEISIAIIVVLFLNLFWGLNYYVGFITGYFLMGFLLTNYILYKKNKMELENEKKMQGNNL